MSKISKSFQEILFCDIDRSFEAVIEAWNTTENLNEDDMCIHMEAIIDVINGKINFEKFKETTKLECLSCLQ